MVEPKGYMIDAPSLVRISPPSTLPFRPMQLVRGSAAVVDVMVSAMSAKHR